MTKKGGKGETAEKRKASQPIKTRAIALISEPKVTERAIARFNYWTQCDRALVGWANGGVLIL